MTQADQSILQDRRSSRGSLIDSGRLSKQDDIDFVHPAIYQVSTGYGVQQIGMGMPPPVDARSDIGSFSPDIRGSEIIPDIPRRSSLKKSSEKYGQTPRNIYMPLNNENRGERGLAPVSRKPADLTIINNTVASSQLSYKNINAHANLAATSSLTESPPQQSTLRRGSEPPRPIGRNPVYLRNKSFDDLGSNDLLIDDTIPDSSLREARNGAWRASIKREEDRENTRTISRAHLRRDSFGEVVSRRSPSPLEMSRNRSSPDADDPEGYHPPLREILGETEDIWSCTASSRHSPSQDSLHRQDYETADRAASQESLGTMSSRGSVSGSIFSMTSARSDAVGSRWHPRDGSRSASSAHHPPANGTCVGKSYLNGDLGESAASTDDLAHQAVREGYREPTGLHRTSSEPYYNFESMDIPDGALFLHNQGMISGQTDYHQPFEPETRTLGRHRNNPGYGGFGGIVGIEGSALVGYSHSLRGRSHSVTRSRATTSSVAAAIAAARAKNASDNALDHDTSILPIFQKLLSERQRSYSGRGRNFTMSSCPNITIKCDIVEYL